MNLTIKSNIPLMIFFSILSFGLMAAVAAGVMHKSQGEEIIMLPFSFFFFFCGCLPFFSWKRSFERAMTLTSKGVEFQLKPGKGVFFQWSEIQAIGMGVNTTVYLKDRRKLTIFWTGIDVPAQCEGYPVYKNQSKEINALKPRMWLMPLFILGILFISLDSGAKLSATTRHIIMTFLAVTALYKLYHFLRDYLFRS